MKNLDRDVLIRNGLVVDGNGAEPKKADVLVKEGLISDIAEQIAPNGVRELDATGCYVTPGFVDVHTHYDAQATWSDHMSPSSSHGVTTAVMGNCGVGFAPCKPEHREGLIELMEGVEDIPGVVMAEGLPWDWESLPEFMNSIGNRPRDIDLGVLIPHSPLRVYAMGERGLEREKANATELQTMADLAKEAAEAGALGFATSRLSIHKSIRGDLIPTYKAATEELITISQAAADGGAKILQSSMDPSLTEEAISDLTMFAEVSRETGLPFTFSMSQPDNAPEHWREILKKVDDENSKGAQLWGQVLPRPIGLIAGLDATAHPFSLCPSYKEIASLPLAEKVERMRNPRLKAKLLAEEPADHSQIIVTMSRNLSAIYELGIKPNYEPSQDSAISERAKRANKEPLEFVYDLLLENNGSTLLFIPIVNYHDKNLNATNEILKHPNMILGLGDGGAHYGLICDSSYPTFVLQHWARDRDGEKWSLGSAVKRLTSEPAKLMGFTDRGIIAPGYRADINVIDFDHLTLHRPEIARDLPGGGRRLNQTAKGYRETLVQGASIFQNDQPTGQLPGRLIRGL